MRFLDLPTEAFTKPQVWTRYLLVESKGNLLPKGYTKPKMQTFSQHVDDSMNDSKRGLKTYVSYVWFGGEWVKTT